MLIRSAPFLGLALSRRSRPSLTMSGGDRRQRDRRPRGLLSAARGDPDGRPRGLLSAARACPGHPGCAARRGRPLCLPFLKASARGLAEAWGLSGSAATGTDFRSAWAIPAIQVAQRVGADPCVCPSSTQPGGRSGRAGTGVCPYTGTRTPRAGRVHGDDPDGRPRAAPTPTPIRSAAPSTHPVAVYEEEVLALVPRCIT